MAFNRRDFLKSAAVASALVQLEFLSQQRLKHQQKRLKRIGDGIRLRVGSVELDVVSCLQQKMERLLQ